MRWELIDKFEVLKRGEISKALKTFSGREDFFAEHYPGRPLVPEPFFIEMVAQAGGVLFGLGFDFKKEVILAKITEAKFFKLVAPPCLLTVEAVIEEEREEGAWISGTVRLGSDVVSESKMLLVAMEGLGDSFQKKIVFTETFLKHYDIYNIARLSEALT